MESLGNFLKTAREEKKLSCSDVSRETNISSRYIEALEKEDFSKFPGELYALGYLKSYGQYLGLNSEELLSLYRSLKLREQPVPVEALLRDPSKLPKILGLTAVIVAALALAAGIFLFVSRFPRRAPPPAVVARQAAEYILNADFLERRLYPGDSVIVTEGTTSYKLVFSNLSDAVTITTPNGPVMLDLGQEVALDLNTDGFQSLRIIAVDFAKNDVASGAFLRFEQKQPPQTAAVSSIVTENEIPAVNVEHESAPVILSSVNPHPFTLQVVFQGYCLFRYEILYERDRPGRNEQYYQRSEEINIYAQNGIRLGISNARAVRLQVIGGGRTVPFEVGNPGEVVASDLRWIRDEDNRYRLVLLRLE